MCYEEDVNYLVETSINPTLSLSLSHLPWKHVKQLYFHPSKIEKSRKLIAGSNKTILREKTASEKIAFSLTCLVDFLFFFAVESLFRSSTKHYLKELCHLKPCLTTILPLVEPQSILIILVKL